MNLRQALQRPSSSSSSPRNCDRAAKQLFSCLLCKKISTPPASRSVTVTEQSCGFLSKAGMSCHSHSFASPPGDVRRLPARAGTQHLRRPVLPAHERHRYWPRRSKYVLLIWIEPFTVLRNPSLFSSVIEPAHCHAVDAHHSRNVSGGSRPRRDRTNLRHSGVHCQRKTAAASSAGHW